MKSSGSIITLSVASTLLLFSSSDNTVSSFSVQRQQQLRTVSSILFVTKPKVFIDGEAGTTGIQVRDRISKRNDLEIISAPFELRKDEATRKKLINEADAVILCKFINKFCCCCVFVFRRGKKRGSSRHGRKTKKFFWLFDLIWLLLNYVYVWLNLFLIFFQCITFGNYLEINKQTKQKQIYATFQIWGMI